MKKKTLAIIILTFFCLLIGGCLAGSIYLTVKAIQGPEVKTEGGYFYQKRLHFKFQVPPGFYVVRTSTKPEDPEKVMMRLQGRGKSTDASEYLPAISVGYEELPSASKTKIKAKMESEYNEIKSAGAVYKDLKIMEKEIKNDPRFDASVKLAYSFSGNEVARSQVSERRYILKGNVSIWFMYADFEDKYNPRIMLHLIESLTFE